MYLGLVIDDNTISSKTEYIKYENIDNIGNRNEWKLPTLIVGKENVIKLFPDFKIKYIDRKIKDHIYWTFSKYEKRNLFEEDYENFKKMLMDNMLKKVKYYSLGLIYMRYSTIKRFLNLLRNKDNKITFISNKGIYIYWNYSIFGISLEELEYINLSKERIILYLNKINNIEIIYNNNFINNKFYLEDKYVPYIYYLNK